METKILRKVQENYGRWKDMKGSHSKGHWQETGGKFRSFSWYICITVTSLLVVFSLGCFTS